LLAHENADGLVDDASRGDRFEQLLVYLLLVELAQREGEGRGSLGGERLGMLTLRPVERPAGVEVQRRDGMPVDGQGKGQGADHPVRDGVRPVARPAVVPGKVVDLDDDAVAEAVQAGPLRRAVLDLVGLRGEVLTGDDGEGPAVAAEGESAGRGGGDHLGGQADHPVEENVQVRGVGQQAEQLPSGCGQCIARGVDHRCRFPEANFALRSTEDDAT
jgi:hypothetical protein